MTHSESQTELANKLVDGILDELTSRNGFDDVWDDIDNHIQQEIIIELQYLVTKILFEHEERQKLINSYQGSQ